MGRECEGGLSGFWDMQPESTGTGAFYDGHVADEETLWPMEHDGIKGKGEDNLRAGQNGQNGAAQTKGSDINICKSLYF